MGSPLVVARDISKLRVNALLIWATPLREKKGSEVDSFYVADIDVFTEPTSGYVSSASTSERFHFYITHIVTLFRKFCALTLLVSDSPITRQHQRVSFDLIFVVWKSTRRSCCSG